MTRDEILKMEAGEEMDRLVAEKVMGWKIFKHDYIPIGTQDEIWGCDNGVHFIKGIPYKLDTTTSEGNLYSHSWKNWEPSINILAAWEVVEKMNYLQILHLSSGEWQVVFSKTISDIFHLAYAETAPLAICRAALLAVMYGGEK